MTMTHLSMKQWLRLAGLGLLLGACTSEVGEDSLPGGEGAITFRASEVDTKAVVDNVDALGAFSVWGWYADDATGTSAYPVFEGTQVSKNGMEWKTAEARYWVKGKVYDFYAVHPATGITATCSEEGVLTVSDFTTNQMGVDVVDLLTGAPNPNAIEATGQAQAVPLSFRHELARVRVSVRTDQGVEATVHSATLGGFINKGTLTRNFADASASTWQMESSSKGNFSFTGPNVLDSSRPSVTLFDGLLLIPQLVGGIEVGLTFSRAGQAQETVPIDLGDRTYSWQAGQAYNYVLTIEADAITFSDFTVDEWGESHAGGDINVGE